MIGRPKRQCFGQARKERFHSVKKFLLLVGIIGSVLSAISNTSRAAPPGGGFRGGGFHGSFMARRAGPAFPMGHQFRRGFPFRENHDFDRRDRHFFVQQVVWPVYWNPYYGLDYYPWDVSYLDYGPDNDYGYASSVTAPVQPAYSGRATTSGPLLVIVNQGNTRSTDSSYPERASNSNDSNVPQIQQSAVAQGSGKQTGMRTDPLKFTSPEVKQAAQAPVQAPQPAVQTSQGNSKAQVRGSAKLVLVSWLNDSGKDVIYVQNAETNEVQKITSEPNRDNFRIVEMHPNPDPKESEAIISNGTEQIPVRFRF
jgi:hypothetical protein